MTPRDFCYWLQGMFELNDGLKSLNETQTKLIKQHLKLVFIHSIDEPDPTEELQAVHDGKKLLTEDDKKDLEKKIKDLNDSLSSHAKYGKHSSGLARC